MDLYNALKPVFLFVIFLIAAGKSVQYFGQSQTKQMWLVICIGGVLMFFVGSPDKTLGAFHNLMNGVVSFISGIGNGGG